MAELREHLVKFYGPKLLGLLQCALPEEKGDGWLGQLLRKPSTAVAYRWAERATLGQCTPRRLLLVALSLSLAIGIAVPVEPAEILARAGVEPSFADPHPIVSHAVAREVALEAFAKIRTGSRGQRDMDAGAGGR